MKKIFLTGASSGIGLAIATELTARGHEVWGTSRDRERVPKLARLHAVALDLSDEQSIHEAFHTAFTEAGQLDVVINNAGAGQFGAAESLPVGELRKQFQVLVFGQIQLVQLALAEMRRRDMGLIINVTSLAARIPVPYMACYNAAKAAVAVWTMSLQLELAGSGVRLVDLQPADIATSFNNAVLKTHAADSASAPQIARTWSIVEQNVKNAPPPEIVARAVARLIEAPGPPPRLAVGDFFQASIAPMLARFLPQRLQLWGIGTYYRL
ncbi:MAG: SDR family NAD(P)-dependent oxidoreductase [Chthoniobacterales bacterium]